MVPGNEDYRCKSVEINCRISDYHLITNRLFYHISEGTPHPRIRGGVNLTRVLFVECKIGGNTINRHLIENFNSC